MANLLIGCAIALVVSIIALIIRQKQVGDVPTQKQFLIPSQIDRADFLYPAQPWLVLVFTSQNCHVCIDIWAKVQALASHQVGVQEVEYSVNPALHRRYKIEAVPAVLICNQQGVVMGNFLGPVSATDLWAAVAQAREN